MGHLASSPQSLARFVEAHEGALSQTELARYLGLHPHRKAFKNVLMAAYGMRLVDLCGGYVVTPYHREAG